jgi:hypothetical protein
MSLNRFTFLLALASTVLLATFANEASAQIRSPGAHVRYTAEVEPHLVLQHSDGEGIGVGMRASFPIIDNGPIRTINNSLALGIGLDWAHWDDECGNWADCDGNDFLIPFVVQWNFFFTDFISAFPELGVAVEYESWEGDDDWDRLCRGRYCDGDGDGDIDIEFVIWLGVRLHITEEIAVTIRLGRPSVLIGVSFFL